MKTLQAFWFSIAVLALVLGIIGAFLPILPTVPFLLLAALGFSKSSTRLHNWLINHKALGPPIREWQANGAISKRVKIYASLSMVTSIALALFLTVPLKFVSPQVIILILVAFFIWSRPEK